MAVRVPEPDAEFAGEQRSPGEPALTTALALATVLLVLLLANGRPALAIPPRLPATVRGALPVDETAAALAGKAIASLLTSLAAAALFIALGRRWPESMAGGAAAVLALGTPATAASQALWPQPAAVFFVSVALLFICRAEHEPVWAGRAGLPLRLAVLVNPRDAALVGVLALALALRRPRRIPWLLAFGAAPVVAGLA